MPQKLATANYFGALGDSGRTSLILTPAQYRNYRPARTRNQPNNTERAYARLGFRLFYSSPQSETFGCNGNQPALAAAPAISDVQGMLGTDNRIHFRMRATGDLSAGVQQVWVALTEGPDANGVRHLGSPVNLTQDPLDSTVLDRPARALRRTRPLERCASSSQAANGVGAVGIDTADGDGYEVAPAGEVDTVQVTLAAGEPTQAPRSA